MGGIVNAKSLTDLDGAWGYQSFEIESLIIINISLSAILQTP
jgi:hypothetical protein